MSLLIIGSTGTLGRQIVRIALNHGFQVKCLIRNFRRAGFLKELGAELVYGDLNIPETIPPTLYNVTAIIDASASRPNDLNNIEKIDLASKYVIIQAAKQAQIKHLVFFSFINSGRYSHIPLINLKLLVENQLVNSNISYTIFYLSGFFQGLINQYAVPILDQKSVWVTSESNAIAYINTQDVAKIVIKSLSIVESKNIALPIVGIKAWKSSQIINLCEKISGKQAKISIVPVYFIKIFKNFTSLFQWTWPISERLAFIEILSTNNIFNTVMDKTLTLLLMQSYEIESLEEYIQDYFEKIMTKIKKLNDRSTKEQVDINNFSF
uniref:NmrA-like domain-containing protein n=1 Tax=Platysiphonia delicata TaxID=2006979 RepID=A0A1Z1M117_9FLOR|nr:hypothetical protein [Platysiphonia delicata]ARW59572.1 hypothetical protein [Platysiphonia delicata]